MVRQKKQDILLFSEANEKSAQQQIAPEVKRPSHRLIQIHLGFCFPEILRMRTQVGHRKVEVAGDSDPLLRLPVYQNEGGAKYFVTLDDLALRSSLCVKIENFRRAHGIGLVISEAIRLKLIEEPKSLLAKRKR